MNTLRLTALAVLVCVIAVPAFAEDPDYSVWRRTRGPDKSMELQQRPDTVAQNGWRRVADTEPAQAETVQEVENDDPPTVPQGDPSGCEDMFVVDRVTNQAVQRSKWKDFFQNTSYVHITGSNVHDVPAHMQDGRGGSIAKNICPGGSITFSYRRTSLSKKDSKYVVLRAVLQGTREPIYSPSIPLWLPDTNVFYWDIGQPDTMPSVREFQPDGNYDRFNEERDRKIDCKLYPYECYYGGYYGYGRGYGYGRTVGRPFFGPGYDTNPFRHLAYPPYVRPRVMPGCNLDSVEDCVAQEEFLPRIPRSGVMPYRRIGGNPVYLPQAGWHVVAGGAVRAGGSIRGGGAVRCSDPRCFSGYDNRRPPVFKTY